MSTYIGKSHILIAVRVMPDVPLKWERHETDIVDHWRGRHYVCRCHPNEPCPQGERCIGRGRCRWGALVYVHSRVFGSGDRRVTGFARLEDGRWRQVTPDLHLDLYDRELGHPLDFSDPSYLTGPVAEWLDGEVAEAAEAVSA